MLQLSSLKISFLEAICNIAFMINNVLLLLEINDGILTIHVRTNFHLIANLNKGLR